MIVYRPVDVHRDMGCPLCGASAGESCRGMRLGYVHAARLSVVSKLHKRAAPDPVRTRDE